MVGTRLISGIEDNVLQCKNGDSIFFSLQDPSINITELKDIHSEINLTVPDPILVPHLHDGLETVRTNAELNPIVFML